MKIAICDDEKEFRKNICEHTTEYFNQHHIEHSIDEFENGNDLLNSNTNYDILFLDIELGDSNGIDIAKKIQKAIV